VHSRSVAYASFVIIFLGLPLVSTGCEPIDDADTGAKSREVGLSAKDNGGQVEVAVGQTLILTLESNPTTGYRWEVVEAQDAVLRQTGEAEFAVASELDPPPSALGGGCGAPGDLFHPGYGALSRRDLVKLSYCSESASLSAAQRLKADVLLPSSSQSCPHTLWD